MKKENDLKIEKRKKEILKAALKVFARKGYHQANVSDIASEAGVSQGTIYHYFSSKEELLINAFEQEELNLFYNNLTSKVKSCNSATEKLSLLANETSKKLEISRDLLLASVEFWSHIPQNPKIQEKANESFYRMRKAIETILLEGIQNGEFQAVNTEHVASLMIAVFDGLIVQCLANKNELDWQAISQTLTQIVLDGIKKEPSNGK
ncbi:MAG: TetR/AcrR family transcriptional regulator [Candidatus Hydrogenedentota bacterium]|nr:MAG: TetR/AcrR family transcriptional regulator [Candidatus Hydrogenedentota bacterium]